MSFASMKAKANTIHKTSVRADSKIREVFVWLESFRCWARGMTTAEDVPAKMLPVIMLLSKSIPKKLHITLTITAAERKLLAVSLIVERHDSFKSLMLIPVPPSKRITTSVTEVNTLPMLPKSSGVTKFKTGPIKTPIISNKRTSGIFFLLKIMEKRCAEKTSNPKNISAVPITFFV